MQTAKPARLPETATPNAEANHLPDSSPHMRRYKDSGPLPFRPPVIPQPSAPPAMLGKQRSAASLDHYKARSDISRLLDPSYTTSYYNSQQRSTYGAYVDAQGNMHDPDYRAFPLIQQTSSSRRNASATRPHWELVEEDALLLDEDDEPLEDSYSSKRNSYTRSSPRHYASSHRSSSPSGGMRIYPRSTAFSGAILSHDSQATSWSSSSSESSSPFSACSSVLSPFEASCQEEGKERSRCRISCSLKKRRRRSSASTGSEKRPSLDFDEDERLYISHQEETVQEEEEEEEDRGRRVEEDGDSVPTCSESLKKQWQRWSLSIQFGMFRAERRIKRRVQSLI